MILVYSFVTQTKYRPNFPIEPQVGDFQPVIIFQTNATSLSLFLSLLGVIDRFHCHAIKKLIKNYPVDKVKKL